MTQSDKRSIHTNKTCHTPSTYQRHTTNLRTNKSVTCPPHRLPVHVRYIPETYIRITVSPVLRTEHSQYISNTPSFFLNARPSRTCFYFIFNQFWKLLKTGEYWDIGYIHYTGFYKTRDSTNAIFIVSQMLKYARYARILIRTLFYDQERYRKLNTIIQKYITL